jgi:hypothetical protein
VDLLLTRWKYLLNDGFLSFLKSKDVNTNNNVEGAKQTQNVDWFPKSSRKRKQFKNFIY